MQGYYLSFLITHLINFLLSLQRLLQISRISIPFHIPVLSLSAAMAAVAASSGISGNCGQCLAYIAILGSLLTLFGLIGMEDIRWIRGLLRIKK